MIHTTLQAVIDALKGEFPTELKECRYYKGEFEEGSQWDPIFPIALVNCSALIPSQTSQHGWLCGTQTVNVYVGLRLDDIAQQNFFANFITYITTLTIDGYMIDALSCNLIGYFNGIEAYKFELAITKL